MSSLALNLKLVHARIQQTLKSCHRAHNSCTLIGVTKTKPLSLIQEALDLGLTHLGENYVQEFIPKWEAFQKKPICWHFIGHLQRKKVKNIVGKASLIHTLDSLKLAHEINKQAQALGLTQNCLMQINMGQESTKTGLTLDEAKNLVQDCSALTHLRLQGLMCIPPFYEDAEKSRPYFKELKKTLDYMNLQLAPEKRMTELSMGMSHDFEIALEEGATLIRLGTILFGARQDP